MSQDYLVCRRSLWLFVCQLMELFYPENSWLLQELDGQVDHQQVWHLEILKKNLNYSPQLQAKSGINTQLLNELISEFLPDMIHNFCQLDSHQNIRTLFNWNQHLTSADIVGVQFLITEQVLWHLGFEICGRNHPMAHQSDSPTQFIAAVGVALITIWVVWIPKL